MITSLGELLLIPATMISVFALLFIIGLIHETIVRMVKTTFRKVKCNPVVFVKNYIICMMALIICRLLSRLNKE